MSKNTDLNSPNKTEQYNGSSEGAVWIVVAISVVLGVIAILGAVA